MQQDNENGVSEPSRRRLLKGMGAWVGRWRWRVDVRLPTRKNHKARRERCPLMRVVKRSRFMVSIRQGS